MRLQQKKTHEKEYGELSLFISVLFDLVFIKTPKSCTIKENPVV